MAPGKPPLEPGLPHCLSDTRVGGTWCGLKCWCSSSCQCQTGPAHLFSTPSLHRRVRAADLHFLSVSLSTLSWQRRQTGQSVTVMLGSGETGLLFKEAFGFLQQGEGTPTWGFASLPRGEKTWALLMVEGRIKRSNSPQTLRMGSAFMFGQVDGIRKGC